MELQGKVNSSTAVLSSGFCNEESRSTLKKWNQELDQEKKKLKKLEQNQVRQLKCRQNKRLKVGEVFEKNPEIKEILQSKKKPWIASS